MVSAKQKPWNLCQARVLLTLTYLASVLPGLALGVNPRQTQVVTNVHSAVTTGLWLSTAQNPPGRK